MPFTEASAGSVVSYFSDSKFNMFPTAEIIWNAFCVSPDESMVPKVPFVDVRSSTLDLSASLLVGLTYSN